MKWNELTLKQQLEVIQDSQALPADRWSAWWDAHPELHAKYEKAKVPEKLLIRPSEPLKLTSENGKNIAAMYGLDEGIRAAKEIAVRYNAHERLLDALAELVKGPAIRDQDFWNEMHTLLREFGR